MTVSNLQIQKSCELPLRLGQHFCDHDTDNKDWISRQYNSLQVVYLHEFAQHESPHEDLSNCNRSTGSSI